MKLLTDFSMSEQWALKNEVCPEATDDQLNYFLRVCSARGVDPFSGLLYMQRRFNSKTQKWKCSVSPTVDGSRAAASRTEVYAGSDEPEFDVEDAPNPNWCRVTVYRTVKGERCAFTAKCRWKEFVPAAPNDFQWKAKPYHMLSKVTEVQALRKAFPESVPAAGEDDYADEVESPQDLPTPPAVNPAKWHNAVKAFAKFGILEPALLLKLKISSPLEATPEHMEELAIWYKEKESEIGDAI